VRPTGPSALAPRTATTPAARPATAPAPRTAAPAVRSQVAVVDIGLIFKEHVGFKNKMEDIKKDLEAYDTQMRGQAKRMEELRNQLGQYNPGTPNYKSIEEEMARLRKDLEVDAELKRKEILEREARVYYDVYNEVVNHIRYFANRNGIALVLRFNSEAIEPSSRASVLQGVNRAVVFQQNLNITRDILDQLNPPTGPRTGVIGPPRPH